MSRLGFNDRAYASLRLMGLVPRFDPHYVGAADPSPASPLEVTNAQKLALPPSTPVGTVVHVSDGFVVSGSDDAGGNVFWYPSGVVNGKMGYSVVSDPNQDNYSCYWSTDDSQWHIGFATTGPATSTDDTTYPWQATFTWSGSTGTLTNPAVQTLAAPSSAQGGVAVLGGTVDGLLLKATTQANGKDWFAILGLNGLSWDEIAAGGANTLSWITDQVTGWQIYEADASRLYYSLSDVATPDLASNWKNASDDSPASITVTSVSVGEIYAGLAITNDGITNGSSCVSQPFHGRQYYMGLNGGGSNNMHWDTDYNVWTDDVGVWTTDNVIFPWQGSDSHAGHNGATFARNDVANEANWTTP